MMQNNQENYQTLEWIVSQSESGFFLVIADEAVQGEIIDAYSRKQAGVYDYSRQAGTYTFRDLEAYINSFPETRTFFIANLQLALRSGQDLKRLNFSRDMLARLEKNLIFLVTSYGDNRLAKDACDFYSFIRIRISFQEDKEGPDSGRRIKRYDDILSGEMYVSEPGGSYLPQREDADAGDLRREIRRSGDLLRQAVQEENKKEYIKSEMLLLDAVDIRMRLLGPEHPETAAVYHELGRVCEKRGVWDYAERWYRRAWQIRKKVLGEEHPDTTASLAGLEDIYRKQRAYDKIEQLHDNSENG